jgi:hypothetical protein
MRSILYWSFLILVAILLAYISPFNLSPVIFLAGALLIAAGCFLVLAFRRRQSGVRGQGTHQIRIIGSILLYVMAYWTTTGLFSNVKEQREFWARYEPYLQGGDQHGYTFFYVDHAGSYERIESPELNQLILEKNPGRVRMVLEVVKDFGRLRGYTVRSVESIPVDKAWTDGNPPWDALRQNRRNDNGK